MYHQKYAIKVQSHYFFQLHLIQGQYHYGGCHLNRRNESAKHVFSSLREDQTC